MKRLSTITLSASILLSLSGCMTDDLANKQDVYMIRSQVSEQIIHVEDRLNALEGQADAIERQQESIKNRISGLENTLNNKLFSYQKDITDLKTDLGETKAVMSADVEKKMNIVIEEVIRENQKIAEKINSLQKEKYDLGQYHTVERGEMLSKIAVKYGVSVEEIIEANEMVDPDKLKVGQKLFIPER